MGLHITIRNPIRDIRIVMPRNAPRLEWILVIAYLCGRTPELSDRRAPPRVEPDRPRGAGARVRWTGWFGRASRALNSGFATRRQADTRAGRRVALLARGATSPLVPRRGPGRYDWPNRPRPAG